MTVVWLCMAMAAARERRRQFREKRKQHYNEFQAVQEQKAQNPSKIQRTL